MGRQVTLDELFGELIDACGKDPAIDALQVIKAHLEAGDRIKLVHQPVGAPPRLPVGVVEYAANDDDPTPSEPPWCMARYRSAEGGDYCTWRPGHDGLHVSGDGQKINVVFHQSAGYHEYAGLDTDEIKARRALAEIGEVELDEPASTGATLWKMTDTLSDNVNRMALESKVSKGELVAALRQVADVLTAMMERVEK